MDWIQFFDPHAVNQSPVAAEALRRIAELYEIEGRGLELDTEQRQRLRAQETELKLQSPHDWLQSIRQCVAKVMDYSLKRWPGLSRYALCGALPIDNNPVGNVIRPIAGHRSLPFLPRPV